MDEGLSAVLAEQPLSDVLTLDDLAVPTETDSVSTESKETKEELLYLAKAVVDYVATPETHQSEHIAIKRLLYLISYRTPLVTTSASLSRCRRH